MKKFDAQAFSAALKAKRAETPLRDLAPKVGISFSTLSRIEREGTPSLGHYITLCQWLDVPLERFVK